MKLLNITHILQIFPFAYVLMTRKTEKAYAAVFKLIEEKLFKLEPKEFMCDFEEGMRCAIRKHWRNVRIRGCWYHYKRAINRKCTSLGMLKLFKRNRYARMTKNMLTNLPLLPDHQIIEGFQSIKKFTRTKRISEHFNAVFGYFERYWVAQVRITQISKLN